MIKKPIYLNKPIGAIKFSSSIVVCCDLIRMSYPIAHSLLRKCDAILRITGASKGTDQDVVLGKELGFKIYYNIEDIPDAKQ